MHQLFPTAGLTSNYLVAPERACLERPSLDQESDPNLNCGVFRDLTEAHFQNFSPDDHQMLIFRRLCGSVGRRTTGRDRQAPAVRSIPCGRDLRQRDPLARERQGRWPAEASGRKSKGNRSAGLSGSGGSRWWSGRNRESSRCAHSCASAGTIEGIAVADIGVELIGLTFEVGRPGFAVPYLDSLTNTENRDVFVEGCVCSEPSG